MSSTASTTTLVLVARQIHIYFGFFIIITGTFGQICNIIVFTTLKTFRETTCGFYLTIVSIANLGQILSVIMQIMNSLNTNLLDSGIYCKLSYFSGQYFGVVSLTIMCLTTIDQFLSMTKYQHLNNMKSARCHIIFTCIFWLISGIFTLIYYDSYQNTCMIINAIFSKYYTYGFLLLFRRCLPMTIMGIFSLLAFFKIRSIASRQINNVRLKRDRQLTAMTLLHVLFIIITTVPFIIVYAYILNANFRDSQELARNQAILNIASLSSLEGYAVSCFYF